MFKESLFLQLVNYHYHFALNEQYLKMNTMMNKKANLFYLYPHSSLIMGCQSLSVSVRHEESLSLHVHAQGIVFMQPCLDWARLSFADSLHKRTDPRLVPPPSLHTSVLPARALEPPPQNWSKQGRGICLLHSQSCYPGFSFPFLSLAFQRPNPE